MTPDIAPGEKVTPDGNLYANSHQIDELIGRTPKVVRRAVLAILETPPVITEKEPDDEMVLRNMKILAENIGPKPTDLTLFIPLNGKLPELLRKSGCESLEALVEKIQSIAIKERLGFLTGVDHDARQLVVNIHKQPGKDYSRPMSKEDHDFICLFDTEVF